MNKIEKKEIFNTALEVRKWTEKEQEKENKPWNKNSLKGFCAIAAFELFKRLKIKGFKPYFCFSYEPGSFLTSGHAFIVCKNFIVDVTATQFIDYKRIPVCLKNHNKEKRDRWYHQIDRKFDNELDINSFLSSF